ncbi:dicarboxylate/amino acid:cation symporter [Desulfovibrio sp. OttesenSCG-928-O18]|nr:dicarboxylate/amino acid:cation symporter [Desulfovibrio sp. OttesenSCG-928-O18]
MSESKKMGQSTKILIGLCAGFLFGLICNLALPKDIFVLLNKNLLSPVGTIFLNCLKVTIVPLVLLALICGTASMGDPKKLGRVGGRTMGFYLCTTIVATIIGLILGTLIEPGAGVSLPLAGDFKPREGTTIVQMIVNMFPSNIVQAMFKTDMLQLLVFSIMVGWCFTVVGKKAEGFLNILVQANEIMMKFIELIMLMAPYAVFCLIARVVGQLGLAAMIPLGKYLLCILIGCLIQVFVVYASLLKVFAKKSIFAFISKFFPVMSFAFSTQSSTSTIPINMEICEQNLGVSKKITSFTIPFGATVNMDGTAVLQGVAALFIAQYSGIELTTTQLLTVLVTATLASIGAAGMPGTALIMLTAVCQSVGLPIDAIVLLLSVDRVADMIRTTVNVTGDAVVSLVVAKMEGEFDETVFNAENI